MCSFGSTLPASIGNWTALERFNVQKNIFTGPLPDTMEQWSRLSVFYVGGNQFTGTLPDGIREWAEVQHVCVCMFAHHHRFNHWRTHWYHPIYSVFAVSC
jgi:hypothetical protein